MVVEIVAVVAGLVALTAMVRAGARRIGVPDPIALLVVGAAVSWVPGVPPLRIDPDLVLVVLLPLLLYCAAFAASLPAFRRHIRPILLLSVGLTIVSALAVGVVASAVVPGLGFAAACALGAAVAPPDAVAATAVARGIRLPRRVEALLEGESLFNDAAALTVLTVAVAAATGEGLTFAQASGQFLLSALGGLVIGGLVAAVMAWVRRRVRNPYTDVVVFLVAPFAAYLPADVVGASGLVAVVCTGLYLGHRATTIMEPGARVVTGSVRTAVSWLLEGIVFLLVGLKLRDVIAGLASTPLAVVITSSVAVVITLVVVRVVWLALTEQAIPAALGHRSATWGESTLTAWAGMRGAVSLAAVLTLPLVMPDGQAFPQRDLIVFLTFVVILATLLGQGLTLPLLARRLAGGGSEVATEARQEAHARREAADAALACLEDMEQDDRGGDEVVDQLRRRVQNRRHDADEQLAALESPSHTDGAGTADSDPQAFLEPRAATDNGQQELPRDTYRRYGQAMITAERSRLLSLRDEGNLTEAAFNRIQRELDLEQAALLVR
ncbi:Na+/H+ antiporter [Actinomycetospora corticicola]|uniref:CPA1 family monovalent cation:H+ antiporter n=1 Tax=Actinomycetospora corticicola TaxID=663602 RepID=A0A7Y9J6N6_9PSEU|nr:CPA1 family monovalent cation:H+ antiporter [Actinomycetospora corticicola]